MTDEPIVHSTLDLPKSLHMRLTIRLLEEGKTLKQWGIEQATRYLK